jgi:hypothetical protein
MSGVSAAGRRIAPILLLGMLAYFAVSAAAFAQAGSTGGSVAKTDKSISGSAEPGQPRQKPNPAPTPSARSKIFENPTIGGIRVDGCMKWGPVDCGAPAANHWCRSKGFARAAEWNTERVHPTIFQDPQSSVKVCDYFFCGAFSRIECQ